MKHQAEIIKAAKVRITTVGAGSDSLGWEEVHELQLMRYIF